MTKREAAIITAHTSILVGDIADAKQYIEDILGRPVLTHELKSQKLWCEIKEKSKQDFDSLIIE